MGLTPQSAVPLGSPPSKPAPRRAPAWHLALVLCAIALPAGGGWMVARYIHQNGQDQLAEARSQKERAERRSGLNRDRFALGRDDFNAIVQAENDSGDQMDAIAQFSIATAMLREAERAALCGECGARSLAHALAASMHRGLNAANGTPYQSTLAEQDALVGSVLARLGMTTDAAEHLKRVPKELIAANPSLAAEVGSAWIAIHMAAGDNAQLAAALAAMPAVPASTSAQERYVLLDWQRRAAAALQQGPAVEAACKGMMAAADAMAKDSAADALAWKRQAVDQYAGYLQSTGKAAEAVAVARAELGSVPADAPEALRLLCAASVASALAEAGQASAAEEAGAAVVTALTSKQAPSGVQADAVLSRYLMKAAKWDLAKAALEARWAALQCAAPDAQAQSETAAALAEVCTALQDAAGAAQWRSVQARPAQRPQTGGGK